MIIKNGADFPKIGGVRKDFFAIGLACAIAATALVAVDGHSALAFRMSFLPVWSTATRCPERLLWTFENSMD